MPLTRGQIGGHDNERLAFAFTMMNDGETVQCQISDAAMDEGTPSIARQAQFVAHRDTIDRIASDLFDKAPSIKGYVVRIFSKHIQGADLRAPPLYLRKITLARLLARRPEGIFVSDFEQGEIGPDLFRHACKFGLEGMVSKRRESRYRPGRSPDWIKVKNRKHPALDRVKESFS